MMEFLLALAVILVAVTGLAAGLLFGRGPVRTSCDGMACLDRSRCAGCPNRRVAGEAEQ
jgi:hypothetical protein